MSVVKHLKYLNTFPDAADYKYRDKSFKCTGLNTESRHRPADTDGGLSVELYHGKRGCLNIERKSYARLKALMRDVSKESQKRTSCDANNTGST